jgi:hypothetical protein
MPAGVVAWDGTDGRRSGADDAQVGVLKAQHKKECRGLVVQIRYLKAKFGRESLFRCDLGYQKQYLLVLLAQFEKRYVGVRTCMQGDACSFDRRAASSGSSPRSRRSASRRRALRFPSLGGGGRSGPSRARCSSLCAQSGRPFLLLLLGCALMKMSRRSSEEWRAQCADKVAIASALQDVRKRRGAAE